MSRNLQWTLRIGLTATVLALGTLRREERKQPLGLDVRVASQTCSVELMRTDSPPLRLRLLPDGNVLFSGETMSRQRANDFLSLIRHARTPDLLLIDADESLTFDETASFLADVHSALPTWKVLLVTPRTRPACESLIKTRSVPAA